MVCKCSGKLVSTPLCLSEFSLCCLWYSCNFLSEALTEETQICMASHCITNGRLLHHAYQWFKYLDVEEEELKLLHKLYNGTVLFDVLHTTTATFDERVGATPQSCNKQQPGCTF